MTDPYAIVEMDYRFGDGVFSVCLASSGRVRDRRPRRAVKTDGLQRIHLVFAGDAFGDDQQPHTVRDAG